MKKQFQSKAVPRGTRTIWRYLSALILFFSLSIGQMWANQTDLISGITLPDMPTASLDMSSQTTFTPDANGWIVFDPYSAAANQSTIPSWWKHTAKSAQSPGSAYNPDNFSMVAPFAARANESNTFKTNTGNTAAIRFTGAEKISFLVHPRSGTSGKEICAALFAYDSKGDPTQVIVGSAKKTSGNAYNELLFESLTTSSVYVAYIYNAGTAQNGCFCEIAIKKPVSSTPVDVTGISIAPSPASVKVGKTLTLTATITPNDATDKTVTWSVKSGDAYASVNASTGVVTGLAAGEAVVTATANDGSGVTQDVTVTVENVVCPTSGEVFSMVVTSSSTVRPPRASDSSHPGWLDLATYATISGFGEAKAGNIATGSDKGGISSTAVNLDGNDGVFWVALDCPLQAGDVITATVTGNTVYLTPDCSRASGITLATGTDVTYTVLKDDKLEGESNIYGWKGGGNAKISAFSISRPLNRTITLEYADGVTPDGSLMVVDGTAASKPADPTWEHHRFAGWYNGASPYDWTANVTGDLTLTAHWTQLYTVTYAKGATDATGTAPTQDELAAGEKFTVAANTFTYDGYDFSAWNDGLNNFDPGMEYTMGSANVTLTAQWVTASTKYAITKGSHANGDFTIDPAEQAEGQKVTLAATPDEDYLFSSWTVLKTGDDSETGILVDDNGQFEMPAYAVTVNATFAADLRQKVLYVTNTAEATVKANDKLYAALKDIYNVKIVGPTSDADQSGYALVVLHESVGGGDYNKTAVAAAKAGNTPVLNTKSYFYNDGRFGWGTPNAGQSVKGATLNSAYCNIADHPLFSGVTVTDGFFEITDDAAAKCMQPVGSFTSGKEGYTLATTPNADSGNGAAIHELTPAQRGASAGKYLLISVSNAKLDALNANGQKLFQNAAAYLIGSTSWEPIAVPSSAVIEAAPTAAYSVGDNIALSALAAGVSASTTYTWYKGDTWAAAETAGAIQAAKTAAEGGDSYGITGCALGDAGIYWCVISNGTDCEAKASVEVTVVDASYNISFSSAHGTAPSATTGVSYTLPELTASGWAHQGWTASVNVFVDLEEVVAGTLIANGKMAVFGLDVTFTAVWAQEFQVIFNGNGHGDPIAAQIVVDGELATEPIAPAEIGWDFGGWFTDEACTAGNEWDFANDVVTENTELFAKWTAFDGCALLYPATSGSALNVGDNVDMQSGSKGGSIAIVGMKNSTSIAYSANGLALTGGGSDVISVTLNSDLTVDTKISVTLVSLGTGARGLNLLNATGDKVKGGTTLGWADATAGAEATFSYTVEAADGLEGTNIFRLQRNNSVALKCLKVESCGAAIVYHTLTSAVVPEGKGTVTLGAGSVREGYTTTAEYTITDPAYEFVSWSVSGAGASVESATANPATITVGTADAVVTLNLQLIPVKFTVNYYDGETPMGSELVVVNEHPTASEIDTDKRHFTFQGWSETNGGSVVALNTITRTEVATVNLYAVYAPVACPTSGTIFSMEFDDTKIPASTVKVAKNGTLDAGEYATISGGTAKFVNTETSDKDAITTSGQFKLTATKQVMKIELECVLQEGDIIRVPDNNAKYVISTSDSKTGTYQAQASSQHEFAVTADWVGVDDLYFLYDGTSLSFTQIEVYRRPALTGASLADLTIRQGQSKTPVLTLEPSADAIVTSQEWEIVGTPVNLTGAAIDGATGAITTGTLDDASLNGTITVKVTLNGSIEATCTATVVDAVVQQNVTKSTIWNWQNTGATANIELTNSTDPKRNEAFVLANVAVNNDADFESDKLVVEGQWMVRDFDKTNPYFQGQTIKFNATVAGLVRVKFSNTGGNPARELYINGVGTGNSSANATLNWSDYVEVPAGEVSMTAFYVDPAEGTGQQYIRIAEIEFLALADRREAAWVAPGELGTVCLKDDAKAVGANIYQLQGCNANGYMVFDQLGADEILEAGKPYLFEATRTGNVSFYKTVGANHVDEAENDPEITMGMYGTFNDVIFDNMDVNIYYFSGRHIWAMKDRTEEITVPAYRCYVDYAEFKTHPVVNPNPAPGRLRMMIGVNGKNTPTGIENLNASEKPMKLMIDGQMFILRGEKKYDATGRLVK